MSFAAPAVDSTPNLSVALNGADPSLPGPLLTRTQLAARRREEMILDQRHPGQYIAFIDEWTGETLVRRVVAATSDPGEFQTLLSALPAAVRARVQQTRIPESDGFRAPACRLA